jgi:hypothetical protein
MATSRRPAQASTPFRARLFRISEALGLGRAPDPSSEDSAGSGVSGPLSATAPSGTVRSTDIYVAFTGTDPAATGNSTASAPPLPVGMLTFHEVMNPKTGQLEVIGTQFRYLRNYTGPALDPVNLNYKEAGTRSFKLPRSLRESGLFRVFSDALPGTWGRRQLCREFPETVNMNDVQLLHWLASGKHTPSSKGGGRSAGALTFFTKNPGIETPLTTIKAVDDVRVKSIRQLAGVAVNFSEHELAASLVHGGARPKTTFHDVSGEVGPRGRHYLVKFGSPVSPGLGSGPRANTITNTSASADAFNYARVEHSVLELAKHAGIDSIRSVVIKVSCKGRHVADLYLAERYDRVSENEESAADVRLHRVSALTVTDPDRVTAQDKGDYLDIARAIRKVSTQPEIDIRQLLRRVMFNVAINNSDDHLKNFEFVHVPPGVLGTLGGAEGWRLAPAYDLLPNDQPYPQTTQIAGMNHGSLSVDFVDRIAAAFGVPAGEAVQMRNEVVMALAQWREVFERNGCSKIDIDYMQASIDQAGALARKRLGFGEGQVDPMGMLRSANPVNRIENELVSARVNPDGAAQPVIGNSDGVSVLRVTPENGEIPGGAKYESAQHPASMVPELRQQWTRERLVELTAEPATSVSLTPARNPRP